MRMLVGLWMVVLVAVVHAEPAAYTPDKAGGAVRTIEATLKDGARNRDVPVKVYAPEKVEKAAPVIVFSHGLGGSRDGYGYLGEQWAGQGYIVVHLTHVGSDTSVIKGGMAGLKAAANGENAVLRGQDVSFVLDELEKINKTDPDEKKGMDWLAGKMDLSRVGMAGHSFGAQTTQMISGQKYVTLKGEKDIADRRVIAAVALSPAMHGRTDPDKAFGSIVIPVLHLTGTKDKSVIEVDLMPEDRRVPFDHSTAAGTMLITFKDADHMVFAGVGQAGNVGRRATGRDKELDAKIQKLVKETSTAYWDAYLKQDAEAQKWLETEAKKVVGDAGVVERKEGKGK